MQEITEHYVTWQYTSTQTAIMMVCDPYIQR